MARPQDAEPDDQDEHPAASGDRPEGCAGEQDGERRPDEPDADERPGLLAAFGECLTRDRLLLALVRNDEDSGEVDEDPRAAEQREDDEPEPVERRAEVEVPAEAGADACDSPPGGGTLEAFRA